MTIAVRTFYNTEPDGSPVADDLKFDDPAYPQTYHGPFDTMVEAVDFMENVWPDDDTDVAEQVADDFPDLPAEWLNDPKSVWSGATG